MSLLQEERSAETRRRLLEATVACLHERGYSGTTTIEIANRAGVSRGAQLHHYPTKDELVVSALEYVFDRRVEELHGLISEFPAGRAEDRLCALIDLLWPVFKGPTFYAWLELTVASRTDPALRERVRSASERLGAQVIGGFAKTLEWPPDRDEELAVLISLIFDKLEGLALDRVLQASAADDDPPNFGRQLQWLKKIACWILATTHSNGNRSSGANQVGERAGD